MPGLKLEWPTFTMAIAILRNERVEPPGFPGTAGAAVNRMKSWLADGKQSNSISYDPLHHYWFAPDYFAYSKRLQLTTWYAGHNEFDTCAINVCTTHATCRGFNCSLNTTGEQSLQLTNQELTKGGETVLLEFQQLSDSSTQTWKLYLTVAIAIPEKQRVNRANSVIDHSTYNWNRTPSCGIIFVTPPSLTVSL